MLKYNRNTLNRIEELFESQSFSIIYERGNFKSGYCLVQDKKMIVINKYFDLKSRIECLLEILAQVDLDTELFNHRSKKYFEKLAYNIEAEVFDLEQTIKEN